MTVSVKRALYFALKRLKGSRLQQYYQMQLRHQFDSFGDLALMRRHFMMRLLTEAFDHAPEHRRRMRAAGFRQPEMSWLTRLEDLPLLTREDLSVNQHGFLHHHAVERGLYMFKTGGSTGSPLEIGQDEHYRDWFLAGSFFMNSWNGMTLGKPYFFLWSAMRDMQSQLASLHNRLLVGGLQGRRILNCAVTSPELFDGFLHRMNREQDCRYMVGYAYQLYNLACHALETGQRLRRPLLGIFATAEPLTPHMREVIESAFGGTVLNRYGCRDAGDLACECPYQQGMHINPLYSYLEVVDDQGRTLPYGEEGQLVLTALHNYSMPLIRYAMGDVGVIRPPSLCLCGRNWETLVSVQGRVSERLLLSGGRELGSTFLHTAFDHLPEVRRYQIHQMTPERLCVRLRTPVSDYADRYGAALTEATRKLQLLAGNGLQIAYEQTDDLSRTPTGKELLIIHHFPQADAERSLVGV